MTADMLHVAEWHNGEKQFSPFSAAEMARRQGVLQDWMAQAGVDAVLLTSPHGIGYFSGWINGGFGRRYGMVITPTDATTISAAVDGGAPWRQSHGQNVTYTDWRRDNYYRAVRQLTARVQRLGIEFDHVSLEERRMLDAALPGVEMVDAGAAVAVMRAVKSDEELALLRKAAAIADAGGRVAMAAIAAGVAEHEVASAATTAMAQAVAAAFPSVAATEGWAWFQSGINTDGSHSPATNRVIRSGEILALRCCPVVFGYHASVGRTLFCDHADAASLSVWEQNVAVHRRGIALVQPGARCNEIALELNEMYRQGGLLRYRAAGYGHALGLMGQHFGREAQVELREDVDTVLQPGMVVTMAPMLMLPQGCAGAGGYREQDTLIVTQTGAEVVTRLAVGPAQNIVRREAAA